MIVFDLRCGQNHRFEGWFRSHDDFEAQRSAEAVACPECGATHIEKALSVPNIGGVSAARAGSGREERSTQAMPAMPDLPPALAADLDGAMRQFREHVEANCENVGKRFAEEARRIHYGEADRRSIFGLATAEEGKALIEEGIDILPVPVPAKTDA